MDIIPLDFYSSCIRHFCFELGLEHSLTIILKMLRNFVPGTQISCNIVNRRTEDMLNIVDFSEDDFSIPPVVNVAGMMAELPRFFVPNDEGIPVYIINDTHSNAALRAVYSKVDPHNRSLLSLQLCRYGELEYYLGLRARAADSFTPEHARLFSRLRAPLADLLHEFFQKNIEGDSNTLFTPLASNSSTDLLERCHGLAVVVQDVNDVASTNAVVLIQGESGVGKELVAEAIHEKSGRAARPLVKVNCGAIPESLIQGELFGYEKGAFTGAVAAHKGYFEQADSGTIYLDEIGELSPLAQVHLLRVLETREVQRIGGHKRIRLDFRLVAATNRNLEAMVEAGAFRADLWYRLCVYCIDVPSLEQRREDIPVLVRYFAAKYARELGQHHIPEISAELMRKLTLRAWPGNVRQLRNWVESALIHTVARHSPTLLPPKRDGARAFERKTEKGPLLPDPASPLELEEWDRRYIEWVLERCRGKIQGAGGAAEVLGLQAGTLRARMRRLGIPFPGRQRTL